MNDEAQADIAETVEETQIEDSAQVEDSQVDDTEALDTEVEEQEPETVEDKAARLEKENIKTTRRIGRKTAALSALQKNNEDLQRQLQEMQQTAKPVDAPTEPLIDDFESYEDFQEAVVNHRTEMGVQKALNAQNEAKASELKLQAQKTRHDLVQTQEHDFLQVNPDYTDSREEFVAHTANLRIDPQVENAMIEVALEAGSMADVISYFGENGGERLAEFDEISKLSPWKAAIRIDKIVSSLKSGRPPVEKKKPLPKPIKKVSGSGRPSKGLNENSSGDDVLKQLGFK